jgi:competence protein ComEA
MAADPRPGAAWLLAAALLAWPLLRRPPEAAACPAPFERAQRAGHTTQAGCGGGDPVRGPARLLFGLRLDPNTADAAALEVLPGLGPARARAVVETRCGRPFHSLQDLERVPGIGPRTRAALEPWLAIDPAAEPTCPVL